MQQSRLSEKFNRLRYFSPVESNQHNQNQSAVLITLQISYLCGHY